MRRIIYLSLLLVIPFLIHADHGRDRLNGKWISPFHGKEIKLKVKRHEVRVKNLTRRGWTSFVPSYRGKFEDCEGNTISIRNVHELIYRSDCGSERIRFVKKGHIHHNHSCNSSCGLDNDYFTYTSINNGGYGYEDYYGGNNSYGNEGYSGYGGYNNQGNDNYDGRWANRNTGNNSRKIRGRYFVREINEYIMVEDTRFGLRAKRGNLNWVNYRQNRYRKNEYIDNDGNKYQIRSNGDLIWKNKKGTISLNLSK